MSDTNTMRSRIASESQFPLGNSFGLTGETFATIVNRCINSAIKHYESMQTRFNERIGDQFSATTAGTRTYSLPPDFIRMTTLKLTYNGNFLDLKLKQWEELGFKDIRVDGTSRGVPNEYAIGGNLLRVFPVPNSATMTFYASYIHRFPGTSVTGSYTSVLPMAGSYSLTVTATASHNNRLNGWFNDGEELIRSRALADIKINYRRVPSAITEAQRLFSARESFLSIHERQAFERLSDETFDSLSTGRIEPYLL